MKTNTIKTCFLDIPPFSGSLSAIPSEAEFRKLAETRTLHQDGSRRISLLQRAVPSFPYSDELYLCQTFITYNPDFQELKIHSAYVKQKDGTTIQTPDNAFVEVLPRCSGCSGLIGWKKWSSYIRTWIRATIYLGLFGYFQGRGISRQSMYANH